VTPSESKEPFTVFAVSKDNLQDPGEGEPNGSSKPETMGSKEKQWVLSLRTQKWSLMKLTRENEGGYTGEHWSEKLAAEIATVVGVPHPVVELGHFHDHPVSLTTPTTRARVKRIAPENTRSEPWPMLS